MIKQVIAVSLFNTNRYTLSDIPIDILKKSKAVLFCVDNEWVNSSVSIIECVNHCIDYIRVPMEDIDDIDSLTPHEYHEIEKQVGPFIIPNKQSLSEILAYCIGEDSLIIACSAGVSRSGALVTHLISKGYTLNQKYNTRFHPNVDMLNILTELENHNG